jgi:hypothetical protein
VPLVDTPVTVLERLLSYYEAQTGQVSAMAEQSRANENRAPQREFKATTPPSLRHTRVIEADFAGRKADGWNRLVHIVHIEAVRRLGTVEAVRRITTAKMILGRAGSDRVPRQVIGT